MASSSPLQKEPPPPPPHHLPLKCPRCDSSNTKFCYYNNYSLSQPRHFCKACKRYWTRGGTLRNVPVGGGCRKNKRPKRDSSGASSSSSSAAAAAAANSNPSAMDLTSPAANRMQNPPFYSPVELNFPFSSYNSARVSEFDLQSQMNGLGLGFSSLDNYKNAYKPIQDMITNSSSSVPPFSASGNNGNIFFGSSGFASSSALASLLASSVHDGKSPMQYHDPQMSGGNGASTGKDVKQERENGSVWNPNPNPNQNHNQIEQINSSDPSSFLWNNTNLSAWFDTSSMGSSSVPSLI